MNERIKVETVDNTIMVSTKNFRMNIYEDVAQYDLNNKTGNIFTATVNKNIKNLKTWKAKVEEVLNEKLNWEV